LEPCPEFNPETGLSFQGHEQMNFISHESQRLAELGFAHHTSESNKTVNEVFSFVTSPQNNSK